jgi:putative peptidoglycan lipid II flippase
MTGLASVSGEETAQAPRDAAGITRGAAVIAGLTILARILGLTRTLVFSQTVGATCLGNVYVTANQVPNLVYELVLGGALASAMVPVLARHAERAGADPEERAQVSQISSALLTWSVLILVPVSLIILAVSGPIAEVLNPVNPNSHCVHADVVASTATMLRVFSPQVILYGLSVVLFGLLQAYRRFAGYALAPVMASIVLIAAYLSFAPLGKGLPLAKVPTSAQLVLSVGTTVSVAALVVVALIPSLRLRLRIRPTLRFPPGVARRAGGLAMVGVVELVANDLSTVVVIALANSRGPTGALVLFNYSYQVFASLTAVLVTSIVLSTFPVLASRDGLAFDRTCAGSTRAVLLASFLGMAVIAAVAVPAAHVLAKEPDQVSQLIQGFLLFAPGLAGVAVIANLSRVMLAMGRLKVAAIAVSGSWVLVMVAQVVLVFLVKPHEVVGALALGSTIGQTAAAIPLVIVTRRIRGHESVQGVVRATFASLAAGLVAAVVGIGLSIVLPHSHKLIDFGVGVVAATGAIIAFGLVALVLDGGDLRAVLARIQQVVRLRVSRRAG